MLHLSGYVGKRIEISGRRATAIAQHLVGGVPGKRAEYFDPDDGGNQIVVHVAAALPADATVVLWGTVLEERGASKRPAHAGAAADSRPSKADPGHVEYALDVESVVVAADSAEIPALIDGLADPAMDEAARGAVEERIVAAGLAALPALLERRDDARPAGTRLRIGNLAELTNRPAVIDGPEPVAHMGSEVVTLGARATALLYRIVTPRNYDPPGATAFKPRAAAYDGYGFRVTDWPAFVAARRGRSLAEIRAGLEPALAHWYRTKGEEQDVE